MEKISPNKSYRNKNLVSANSTSQKHLNVLTGQNMQLNMIDMLKNAK